MGTRRSAAVVALAVVGLLAGCASQGDSSGGTIGWSTSETAAAAAPSLNADDSTRVASWRLLSSSADGSTLSIGVAVGGGCERLDRVDVVESESSVTITPILLTGLAEACADSLTTEDRAVSLQNPLGERTLVHGD